MPPGASSPSSGHVSPRRALFCVVAKTGMLRMRAARSSFCVVAMTLGNSNIAGRNFSCRSQILEKHQRAQLASDGAWHTRERGLLCSCKRVLLGVGGEAPTDASLSHCADCSESGVS